MIDHFIQPNDLINYLKNLTKDDKEQIAKNSFFHPNGFYKIMLSRNSEGYCTRLHLWRSSDHFVSKQQMHNHGWDFTSHILYGKLIDVHYKRTIGVPNMLEYDDEEIMDGKYNFTNPVPICCVESGRFDRIVGTSYGMTSDLIHMTHPVVDMTITLIHQTPFVKSGHIFIPIDSPLSDQISCEKNEPLTVEELFEVFDKIICLIQITNN
jgi:hypothetical protein